MTDAVIDVLRPRRCGLTGAEEEHLERSLVDAVPDLRLEEMFRLRASLLSTYDHLLVGWAPDGTMAGLLGCTWRSCRGLSLLHVGIQMIAPAYRGGRLFADLWHREIVEVLPAEDARPSLVAVKTYNPLVYLAMRSFARLAGGSLYPDVGAAVQDPDLVRLASSTHSVIAPDHEFDPATGAVRGAGVPPDLYEAVPDIGCHPVERYFGRYLNPGDRLLCLMRCPGFDEEQFPVARLAGHRPGRAGRLGAEVRRPERSRLRQVRRAVAPHRPGRHRIADHEVARRLPVHQELVDHVRERSDIGHVDLHQEAVVAGHAVALGNLRDRVGQRGDLRQLPGLRAHPHPHGDRQAEGRGVDIEAVPADDPRLLHPGHPGAHGRCREADPAGQLGGARPRVFRQLAQQRIVDRVQCRAGRTSRRVPHIRRLHACYSFVSPCRITNNLGTMLPRSGRQYGGAAHDGKERRR
jgi:hypothetical protein